MKILPAINAKTKKELEEQVKLVSGLVDIVHIDIMDGIFVPSETIQAKEVNELKDAPNIQIHLMALNPLKEFEKFNHKKIKEFIIHAESDKEIDHALREIKKSKIKAGLAFNPETNPEKYVEEIKKSDIALVMSVHPGFSGQKLIPESLDKINEIRSINKKIKIGVDGGINKNTAAIAKSAGADFVCTTSALYNSKSIEKSLKELKKE